MYLKHFNLSHLPFSITPKTEFFLDGGGHFSAYWDILKACEQGDCLVKVVAEVGCGKTILCRKVLEDLPDRFVTALIPQPIGSPEDVFRAILLDLQIKVHPRSSLQVLLAKINDFAFKAAENGEQVVIFIDEAQALTRESLEAVRLLTNLETNDKKLVQVILFGQTELDDILQDRSLRQLVQRISVNIYLQPMTRATVKDYVFSRLQKSGNFSRSLFHEQAFNLIYKNSKGIPRMVNILSDKAMLNACQRGSGIVSAVDVKAALVKIQQTSNDYIGGTRVTYGKLFIVVALVGISLVGVGGLL